MQFKVMRDIFIDHKGEKIKKGETFVIDDSKYGLKSFYMRRVADGDIIAFQDKQPKEAKKIVVSNKAEGK